MAADKSGGAETVVGIVGAGITRVRRRRSRLSRAVLAYGPRQPPSLLKQLLCGGADVRYTATRTYSGAAVDALRVVEETLLPNGFRIVNSGPSQLKLRGPGMWNSKGNPIRGATVVSVEAHDSVLQLDTSLGGVVRISVFACVFPVVLWLVIGLTSATKAEGGGLLAAKSLYGIGTWLVIGPALSYWIRKRTIGALNTMLFNASFSSGRS